MIVNIQYNIQYKTLQYSGHVTVIHTCIHSTCIIVWTSTDYPLADVMDNTTIVLQTIDSI